jgi:hypothetical protein
MFVQRSSLLPLIGIAVTSVLVLFMLGSQPAAPVLSAWSPNRPGVVGQAVAQQASAGAVPALPAGATLSVPLSMAGDVGFNVLAALDARSGALRSVTIQPGETWSFNATVGDPSGIPIRTVGGVPGGGWCDLASRYVQAVRPILPRSAVSFVNHVTTSGIRIADIADDDAVSIWNIDGQPGSSGQRQDLEITNTLGAPLHLQVAVGPDGQLVVSASVSSQ